MRAEGCMYMCEQQILSLVDVPSMRETMRKSLNVATAFQRSLDLCNKFLFLD